MFIAAHFVAAKLGNHPGAQQPVSGPGKAIIRHSGVLLNHEEGWRRNQGERSFANEKGTKRPSEGGGERERRLEECSHGLLPTRSNAHKNQNEEVKLSAMHHSVQGELSQDSRGSGPGHPLYAALHFSCLLID